MTVVTLIVVVLTVINVWLLADRDAAASDASSAELLFQNRIASGGLDPTPPFFVHDQPVLTIWTILRDDLAARNVFDESEFTTQVRFCSCLLC